MTFEQLIQATPPEWLLKSSDADDITTVTVGRLVRNLDGFPFPGWSTADDRKKVSELILPVLRQLRGMKNAFCAELSDLSYEQRRLLLARKQLTPCMAARQDGCHILIPPRQNAIYMVNEEEHLVVHCCQRGNRIRDILCDLSKIAATLDGKLNFARLPETGNLTSLPSEAGDGLQLYTMLHLPALTLGNMMSQVTKALEKLHINISPCYSDGEDDTGSLFILYTLPGPIDSTAEIAGHYQKILRQLITRERQVRQRLLEDPELRLADNVARAYGTLRHARRLTLRETRNALSMLRLGTATQVLEWENLDPTDATDSLKELDLIIALTSAAAREEEEPGLPTARATLTRSFLKAHPLHFAPEFS